jgi:biopolymer transport protein ExbB
MTSLFLLAQASQTEVGWLSRRLLVTLSVLSLALMLERAVYFATHRLTDSEALTVKLARGEFDSVRSAVEGKKGMEAAVIREGLASTAQGPDTVEQVIASTVSRERPQYERYLSFLGTLGNNAPFIGLFGTVLGIIKAFHDLGAANVKGAAIQQTVMAGISEALVATAVGLAVAIPAVVGFNVFNRQLKTLTSRTNALGFALVGSLRAEGRKPSTPGEGR